MTLYKQLVAGMVTVLILLMICVFIIEFKTTRNNLEQQQRSEVSNTINTVGLALAPYLENKDTVAAESVINALFDGSTYSVVRLRFLDDDAEIVRAYPIKPSQVPQWFTNLNLFEPIHDRRVVTSGWLQLAEVEIVSHPGEAYAQLWQALIRLCLAFGSITLVGLMAIALIVRHALKPLQMIVQKMAQIARNQFGDPLPLPDTRDLTAVVEGINSMSAQVEKYFKAQAQEAQMLRERAYIDPVSQLGNRAYYMNQLNGWLSENAVGGVAILQAQFIKELYEEKGYEAGDGMVRDLAAQLKATVTTPNATIARISTDEFGLILPNLDESELRLVADGLINAIQVVNPDPTGMAAADASLGVVHNKESKTSTEMLSLLDNAVATSKANPELKYGFVTSATHQVVMGKQQWKALVEEAIHHDWVTFRFQAANHSDGQTFHREVFSAIEKDNVRYSANQYLFALEQLHASHLFDQYVLQAMVEKLDTGELTDTLAINIAQSSIEQPSFIRWVTQLLARHKSVCDKLHFEIPESCFVNAPHHTALFCHAVRSAGAGFGVDNYGRNFQSLDYINEFRPDYVKLDYLFTHHLDDEKQKFTLTSISRTAHDLGVTTIASRVETQVQLDFLSEHFIDVFQGFIVDR
ncbi:EAL domain-containing protein [Vibrio fluvialis]|uniref:bifunctional diguanylate cyclase/phosphodiesterase n=1 Tax=Vibrio fluvialis TaxID=676 RepID=UPI001C9D5842|nr:EAL domain-containing protein [Vibrio fluvialis]MBY7810022.1 EAL domain-containing protein [Vibrio fluvialis]MBY7869464.1 EAL domain-containing protein [Vibrio fluvialis]MBY8203773.1 EAL domain-containing protein [Vibrio fluvialis]MBY8208014.1 EAL domain-containing protein [Vibrio fluvialis]MBY8292449.1 EAL domain-containing protein [Vibrio fluvialis]